MSDKNRLGFGYNQGLPPNVRAAWGARWIVNQDGMVDPVHDRQDSFGSKNDQTALHDWLNTKLSEGWGVATGVLTPFTRAKDNLRTYLEQRIVKTREDKPVILHQDHDGVVFGNTNASGGYFYVAAYLFEHLPEDTTTRGLEYVLAPQE